MPEPAPPPVPAARARKRLDVDQLAEAFRQASGGIGWTEIRDGREIDLFEDLAVTLGRPDYAIVTTESTEPSALFQKFLDDAARQVCARRVEADLADPSTAILLPAEGVDDARQLIGLAERFHGRTLEVGDPDLARWAWLLQSARFVAEAPTDGWQAVCVGLFTHPDFFTY